MGRRHRARRHHRTLTQRIFRFFGKALPVTLRCSAHPSRLLPDLGISVRRVSKGDGPGASAVHPSRAAARPPQDDGNGAQTTASSGSAPQHAVLEYLRLKNRPVIFAHLHFCGHERIRQGARRSSPPICARVAIVCGAKRLPAERRQRDAARQARGIYPRLSRSDLHRRQTIGGDCPPPRAVERLLGVLPTSIKEASYTQWEFFLARHYKRRPYVYFARDDYVPDETPKTGDRTDLQNAYVEFLKRGRRPLRIVFEYRSACPRRPQGPA